jgi:predicted amidohydrolase
MKANIACHSFIVYVLSAFILGNIAFFPAAASVKARTVKVAVCQIFCLDGDRAGNRQRMELAALEAKKGGAQIVCFPETAFLGWVNPEAHTRAFPIPGEDTDFLSDLARKHEVYVCSGLAEKEGDTLYDSAVLIDNRGQILLKHRKINILEELMTPPYTAGREVSAVDTEFGRIGLLICADTFKDDILERMSKRKPDLVLVPYGWAAQEEKWPEHGKELEKVVSQAGIQIGSPVIGTDLVGEITHGPWTGLVYGGQSIVADASGRILAVARDRDREIMLVTIDLI